MPIVTKTVEGNENGYTYGLRPTVLNAVKALAESLGTEYKTVEMSTEGYTNELYCYVPMDKIGYDGWCVYFYCYVEDSTQMDYVYRGIRRLNTNNMPDLNDEFFIEATTYSSTMIVNDIELYPETCVMICDSAMDTVLFDIHHGSTIHGTELTEGNNNSWVLKTTIFFAKDVNGGILCGIGNDSANHVRTTDKRAILHTNGGFNRAPQSNKNLNNILHLTKMVNYLDPSFPEMKSAYVSVIRPLVSDSETKLRVGLYEINGINWGVAGTTDWDNIAADAGNPVYFPFNPFVNY